MLAQFFARFSGKSNLVKTLQDQLQQTRLQYLEAQQLLEYATHTVAMLEQRETRIEAQIVVYQQAVVSDTTRQRQLEAQLSEERRVEQDIMEAALARPGY